MLQSTRTSSAAFGRTAVLTLIAAAVLSACGGGGGDPGAVPAKSGETGTGTTPAPTPTPVVTETKVSLAIVDAGGAPVTSLSGAQSAFLKATVLNPAGAPAANVEVNFATLAKDVIAFEVPSATTNSSGVATVKVSPASINAAGAATVTATSVVDSKTGSGSVTFSVAAAPLTLGPLSFTPAPTGILPAYSELSLNIPVTSGGQPASESTGLELKSPCVTAGTATLVLGAMSKGVQLATYTNKGCAVGRDVITATLGNSVQTIPVDVGLANLGAIDFTGSSLSTASIVLKGNGGQGRSEAATLTFRAVDQQNNPVSGLEVDFSASTNTGGLTITPTHGRTDALGNVSTVVTSGTIPTPVRIMASANRNGATLSGLSDTLIVSTGLPIQKSMSLSASSANFEGDGYDNEKIDVTVLLADQYGNPVSDNTAVNFVTEGGAIGTSALGGCTTTNGACTVPLRSQAFRPTNGRVTVLAYAQGIETFTDLNGDGQYSCTDYRDSSGNKPAVYRPLVDTCVAGAGEPFEDMGDAFLDTEWDNKGYTATEGDRPFPFNHATYTSDPNKQWGLNYIRRSIEVVFSGSFARATRQVCSSLGCRDWVATDGTANTIAGAAGAGCAPRQLAVRIADKNNNPMPNGTTVSATANKLTVSAVSPDNIASTNAIGGTTHFLTVTPEASCAAGDITLQVKTPKGNITEFKFLAN